ncbi:unnamed protein product [Callosobruchus maculatus]|uniref:Uncharacterized protein n=1 Tax=Callosobruchus maculatus TaxID=64391 RepID=A0A653C647_CALMS|nr:unnamed protein product [Callosobruchus maculatus]
MPYLKAVCPSRFDSRILTVWYLGGTPFDGTFLQNCLYQPRLPLFHGMQGLKTTCHEPITQNVTSPRPRKANQEQTSSHERSSNEGYLPVTVSVEQRPIYKACQHSECRVHAQHDGTLGGTQAQMTERASENQAIVQRHRDCNELKKNNSHEYPFQIFMFSFCTCIF